MEWLDERWSGNRHFKACSKCVAPERHSGCHDHCEKYAAEKAAYRAIQESMEREKAVNACIRASNNRIKRKYGINRKETLSEDYS